MICLPRPEYKNCGIYLIYCETERVAYIGSSNGIRMRWGKHRVALKNQSHDSEELKAVYRRHGFKGLRFIVLENCCERELKRTEGLFLLAIKEFQGLTIANTNRPFTKALPIKGKPFESRLERLLEFINPEPINA